MDHCYAGVAELADAVALGATGLTSLEVQILSPACEICKIPQKQAKALINTGDFLFCCEVSRGKLCPIVAQKMCQNVPDLSGTWWA